MLALAKYTLLVAGASTAVIGVTTAPAAERAHVSARVEVPGKANIFGAGHEVAPDPGGGGAGRLPERVSLPAPSGDGTRVVTFSGVTGRTQCASGSVETPPDGPCFTGGSDVSSFDGIAGLVADSTMFLAGVFLDDREPADPSPERLDFRASALGDSFATLRPDVGQVFFIGDGLDANGLTQTFTVPGRATRLFLGITDAFGFHGAPGSYNDNSGQYIATVTPAAGTSPPPVLGETVSANVVKGEVFIRPPGSTAARASQKGSGFIPLTEARSIPVRSIVDTRRGTVALRSARNRKGAIQEGQFADGVFQVLQSRKRREKGLTTLSVKGSAAKFRRCDGGGRRAGAAAGLGTARASLTRRQIRRLRARARGRYRTRSRYSAATVRGTVWNVTDSCAGTLTVVKRGKVAVRDFRKKKTVVVSAGESYFAKASG